MKNFINNFLKQPNYIRFIYGFFYSVILLLMVAVVGDTIGNVNWSFGFNLFGGSKTTLAKETITSTGGTITVDNPESALNGMTISVPSGAFSEDKSFEIKESEFDSSNLIEGATAITPLITIENGHEFAEEPLTVTIPIDIDSTADFVMGFYYDEDTGLFESVATLNFDSDSISLYTSHFSSLIIIEMGFSEMDLYFQNGTRAVDTGFTPGVDDWQFINFGSEIADYGHCAGQSLTMAWYYQEKVMNNDNADHLFGLYDNDTPDFWLDDHDPYRFASVIQSKFDFSSQAYIDYANFGQNDVRLIYYSFLLSMELTNAPQFMAIYSTDEYGNITGGHAIVAYKMEYDSATGDYLIYVADPNFPGQADRAVVYDPMYGFENYSSGANAFEIDELGATPYSIFSFIGQSGLVDFETIEEEYEKMLNGTVGDTEFSLLQYSYVDSKPTVDTYTLKELPSLLELDDAYGNNVSKSEVYLRVTVPDQNIAVSLWSGDQQLSLPMLPNEDGTIDFTFYPTKGMNEISFLSEYYLIDSSYYIGFETFELDFDLDVVLTKEEILVGVYRPTYNSEGDYNNTTVLTLYANGTTKLVYWVGDYEGGHEGTWTLYELPEGDLVRDQHSVIDEYEFDPVNRTLTRYYDDNGNYTVYTKQ